MDTFGWVITLCAMLPAVWYGSYIWRAWRGLDRRIGSSALAMPAYGGAALGVVYLIIAAFCPETAPSHIFAALSGFFLAIAFLYPFIRALLDQINAQFDLIKTLSEATRAHVDLYNAEINPILRRLGQVIQPDAPASPTLRPSED